MTRFIFSTPATHRRRVRSYLPQPDEFRECGGVLNAVLERAPSRFASGLEFNGFVLNAIFSQLRWVGRFFFFLRHDTTSAHISAMPRTDEVEWWRCEFDTHDVRTSVI